MALFYNDFTNIVFNGLRDIKVTDSNHRGVDIDIALEEHDIPCIIK